MLPTRSLSFAASSESGSIFLVLLSVRTRPLLPLRPPLLPFRPPFKPPSLAAPFCAELDDSPLTYLWNLEGRLAPLLPLLELLLPAVPLPGCLAARDLYGRGLLGAAEPVSGLPAGTGGGAVRGEPFCAALGLPALPHPRKACSWRQQQGSHWLAHISSQLMQSHIHDLNCGPAH